MAGQIVYDTTPEVIVSADTVEPPVSELSPCGQTTMKEFLATQLGNTPNVITE